MSRNIIFVLNTALYDQMRMNGNVSTSIKKLTIRLSKLYGFYEKLVEIFEFGAWRNEYKILV
jgi:hypothetical protein